jgi:predicted nucleic acid-binding protein
VTQDRPDAAELLEAVAEFLFADVREWVPREKRFQVLVAANVCAVVARELRAGEEPLREDLALFRELLDEPPADPSDDELAGEVGRAREELARRIRSGELDARLDELTGRLRDHVRRKLEVARPGYDAD